MKTVNGIEIALAGLASIWSINNIESVLGVVILVIQIIWFIVRITYSVYKKIKSGADISELDKDVSDGVEMLEHIKNNIKESEEHSDADTE